MKTVKGYLKDIVNNGVEGVGQYDLIQLILIDEERVYEPMASVRTRYPNVLELRYEEKKEDLEFNLGDPQSESKDIIELFSEFYEKINNRSINDEELNIIKDVYQKVLEGENHENN